jgi:ABC transport system ATP-binding/permease protein
VPPSAAARPRGSADESRAARKELARIERRLERLARDENTLHAELAAHATDAERVLELDRRLRALVAERAELEDAWLHHAEQVS